MKKELSARQKGDIYWKKRIYYIASATGKGGFKEGYLSPDTAEDALSCYEKNESVPAAFPTGREFLDCPPTAAGEYLFADSVALLMRFSDRIDEIDAMDDEIDSFIKDVFAGDIARDGKVINDVIDDYLTASGMDKNKNLIKDKVRIREARRSFAKNRRLYEEMIRENLKEYSSKIIRGMRDEEGIDESVNADVSLVDRPFEEVIGENIGGAVLYEDELDELRKLLEENRKEAVRILGIRETLFGKVFEKYFNKSMEPLRWQIMMNAFFEYRHAMDQKVKSLLQKREAIYFFARFILADEPVDGVLHELIKEHLDEETEILDEDMPVSDLPGYHVPEEPAFEKRSEPRGYDELMHDAGEIKLYLNAHPGQYDAQSLLSVLTNNEEMGKMLAKSRNLSAEIDVYTRTIEPGELPKDLWFELFDAWVLTETVCKITFIMMEFIHDHRGSTVGEAQEALNDILEEISYTISERSSRVAVRRMVLERSGFSVLQ